MSNERETLADIVADFRQYIANTKMPPEVAETIGCYLDRIEAAAKRDAAIHAMTCEANERLREHLEIALEEDKQPVGNSAAMREALVRCDAIAQLPEVRNEQSIKDMRNIIKHALSAPRRNCDAMPWRKAWDEWRAKHHPQNPQTFNESYEATVAFMEWFTAPASEKGATA